MGRLAQYRSDPALTPLQITKTSLAHARTTHRWRRRHTGARSISARHPAIPSVPVTPRFQSAMIPHSLQVALLCRGSCSPPRSRPILTWSLRSSTAGLSSDISAALGNCASPPLVTSAISYSSMALRSQQKIPFLLCATIFTPHHRCISTLAPAAPTAITRHHSRCSRRRLRQAIPPPDRILYHHGSLIFRCSLPILRWAVAFLTHSLFHSSLSGSLRLIPSSHRETPRCW